jgi:glycine/D-amino acid oxidase-like deaminating enzyme
MYHPARAISVGKNAQNKLSSIRILDLETNTPLGYPCTRILIAAGVWSPAVFETLFPAALLRLPVRSIDCHVMVIKTSKCGVGYEERGSHATFATDTADHIDYKRSRSGGECFIPAWNDYSITTPTLLEAPNLDDRMSKYLWDIASIIIEQCS